MADPYQSDHAGEGVGELLSQFRRPNAEGYVRGICGPVQGLEDSTLDLRADRLIAASVGAQLDAWGRVVGEQRSGLSDDDYRRFIIARTIANRSDGEPDSLLRVFALIAGPATAGEPVRYDMTGFGPAAYSLVIVRNAPMTSALAARVVAEMQSINPAGVGQSLIEASPTAFVFNTGPGFDVGSLATLLE